jgi:aminoglycoside 6'-N-acetyltransferase
MDDHENGAQTAVKLRVAVEADVELLELWDADPDVEASGGDDDLFDWAAEIPRDVSWRDIFIAEEDGRPVGVTVLIDAAAEETHYWGPEVEHGAWAIDIWIGHPQDRNRGLGEEMMRQALHHCFATRGAQVVLIDPLASNTSALRFYERIGFERVGPRTFGDDHCIVMRFSRGASDRPR